VWLAGATAVSLCLLRAPAAGVRPRLPPRARPRAPSSEAAVLVHCPIGACRGELRCGLALLRRGGWQPQMLALDAGWASACPLQGGSPRLPAYRPSRCRRRLLERPLSTTLYNVAERPESRAVGSVDAQ